jgi:hypothetical protein
MSIVYTNHDSRIQRVRPGDREFHLRDGYALAPRAYIEFDPACPASIRTQILWAAEQGWLRPVANVFDYEVTAQLLTE